MAEDCQVAPSFPTESIKVIAESIGISAVGDDVAKELSEEVTFRLKILIQVWKREGARTPQGFPSNSSLRFVASLKLDLFIHTSPLHM